MTLHVYHSESDWYVAESHEDATAARIDHNGGGTVEDWIDDPFMVCHDGETITITFDSLDDIPEQCRHFAEEPMHRAQGLRVTLTCTEWARISGRGFLCSSEY